MSIAEAFADIAVAFSDAGLGAYRDALARWPGKPELDEGGSIATPGTPVVKTCKVQIDAATEAMRAAEGFVDGDVRLLVLAATLDGLDTDAEIEVLDGPYAGTTWMVASVARDPCGVYFEARGRRG